MVTSRIKTSGLSVLDFAKPHFTSIIKGANRLVTAHGYALLLVDTEEAPGRERPPLEPLSRKVDGIIAYSRTAEQGLGLMARLGKPAVLFGPPTPPHRCRGTVVHGDRSPRRQ